MTVTFSMRLPLAILLSFTAGYTDVISLTRWSCFASMMTGNLIKFGIHAEGVAPPANPNCTTTNMKGAEALHVPNSVFLLSVIFVNMCGIVAYHSAKAKCEYGTTYLAPLCWACIVLFEVLEYRGMTEGIIPSHSQIYPLTFMFGMVNAMSTASVVGIPVTMCTGNLGVIAGGVQKLLFGQKDTIVGEKVRLCGTVVLTFTFGCVTGQFLSKHVFVQGNWIRHFLCLPTATLLAIGMVIDDRMSATPKIEGMVSKESNPAATLEPALQEDDEMDLGWTMSGGVSIRRSHPNRMHHPLKSHHTMMEMSSVAEDEAMGMGSPKSAGSVSER